MSLSLSWRKSRSSGGNGDNCVEVRSDLGAVRDSKAPNAGALRADVVGLTRWLAGHR